MSTRDAAYFDGWYADKLEADVLETAKQHCLGHPPELRGTSFLTFDGLHEVETALDLAPGRRLLDLACGAGAFGCWLATRSGCDLVGVDFSRVAIAHASRSASQVFHLPPARFHFEVGELSATGLPTAAVDAVMVIDSIQFAPGIEVAAECHRVTRPGGRVVVTGWEPVDRSDPVHSERIRDCDIGGSLAAAGFVDIEIGERPEWLAAERACWQEIVERDPAEHPALPSAIAEGRRSLRNPAPLRRLCVTAVRP